PPARPGRRPLHPPADPAPRQTAVLRPRRRSPGRLRRNERRRIAGGRVLPADRGRRAVGPALPAAIRLKRVAIERTTRRICPLPCVQERGGTLRPARLSWGLTPWSAGTGGPTSNRSPSPG